MGTTPPPPTSGTAERATDTAAPHQTPCPIMSQDVYGTSSACAAGLASTHTCTYVRSKSTNATTASIAQSLQGTSTTKHSLQQAPTKNHHTSLSTTSRSICTMERQSVHGSSSTSHSAGKTTIAHPIITTPIPPKSFTNNIYTLPSTMPNSTVAPSNTQVVGAITAPTTYLPTTTTERPSSPAQPAASALLAAASDASSRIETLFGACKQSFASISETIANPIAIQLVVVILLGVPLLAALLLSHHILRRLSTSVGPTTC